LLPRRTMVGCIYFSWEIEHGTASGMRRVIESEIENDFERQYGWGDDERYYYNPNRRKHSVLGYFLRLEMVIDLVKKYVPAGTRIADMACAQGNFALTLAEAGYDVLALDLSEDFLRYARKKYTHGKFRTERVNIIEYRSPEKFDCVIMGEIIEHVAFPDQLLKSAAENLNSGGILVLTTPNGNEYGQPLPTYRQVTNIEELIPKQFHWGDHLFLYTEEELRDLLSQTGFEVLEVSKINSQYVSQMKGVRYLLPLKALRWLESKTRHLQRGGKDSTNGLVVVARRK